MAAAWKMLFIFCSIASFLLLSAASGGDHTTAMTWLAPPVLRSGCRGTVAECLDSEDDEFQLDSESTRRILAMRRYISYGALRRNSVPCSRRGASYYNCRPGAQANPYRRGCSAITRCRS